MRCSRRSSRQATGPPRWARSCPGPGAWRSRLDRGRAALSAASLVAARFRARPNRFIVEAILGDGGTARAHLADPGRLEELLLPGVPLRLRPAPPGSDRKTRYTVALVRASEPPRPWVSLDTTLPNRLAAELLAGGHVHGIGKGWTVEREVRHGASRFDFRLTRRGRSMLVEVKSVTLVENGRGLFPDAPTRRGTRHVRELEEHVRRGGRAAVLFVVQRDDARSVSPHGGIDPEFTDALGAAGRAGVLLRAAGYRLAADGRATWAGSLPVRLDAGPA